MKFKWPDCPECKRDLTAHIGHYTTDKGKTMLCYVCALCGKMFEEEKQEEGAR